MPLPDPHAGEPTVEIDKDLYVLRSEARAAMVAWKKEFDRLNAKLLEQMGDAYAATIDGTKVLAHRPKSAYAEARIRKDYPDLTEHFMERRVENWFNLDRFIGSHPDIAERYRVRALIDLGADL